MWFSRSKLLAVNCYMAPILVIWVSLAAVFISWYILKSQEPSAGICHNSQLAWKPGYLSSVYNPGRWALKTGLWEKALSCHLHFVCNVFPMKIIYWCILLNLGYAGLLPYAGEIRMLRNGSKEMSPPAQHWAHKHGGWGTNNTDTIQCFSYLACFLMPCIWQLLLGFIFVQFLPFMGAELRKGGAGGLQLLQGQRAD